MNKPRIILIDPWLSDAGGHNFQYAIDVAEAAEQRGYEVAIVVHRSLPATMRFAASWQVLRTFRFGPCARYWLSPIGQYRHPCNVDGQWLPEGAEEVFNRNDMEGIHSTARGFNAIGAMTTPRVGGWRRWLDWPARLDRRRRIADFVRGCVHSLDVLQPRVGDLFFFPSMSEFEFLGLARFLRDDPRTRDFDWHLQFHFNIFEGREPEFAGQSERLYRFQRQLQQARLLIPHHRLRLYATTAAIARQFDRVEIGTFQPLPYPVRRIAPRNSATPTAREVTLAGPPSPLRVTFAGAMRREKGKRKLGTLITAAWNDCLATGRMQFLFQATPRQVASWLPRHLRLRARIAAPDDRDPRAPLCTAKHPLDAESYAELIRHTDVAVFPYDGRRYYARASGILCEMLAAGVPVIVPAGCWLSDQISMENYLHVTELVDGSNIVLDEQHCELSGEQVATCKLPAMASDLAVHWKWPETLPEGTYLRLIAEFIGPANRDLGTCHQGIVGRPDEGPVGLVVPVVPDAHTVRLKLCSAYGQQHIPRVKLNMASLRAPKGQNHHPRGRVGLIASDEEQVPNLLRDVLDHYQHYQCSSRVFSESWLEQHDARRTLDLLEADESIVTHIPQTSEIRC